MSKSACRHSTNIQLYTTFAGIAPPSGLQKLAHIFIHRFHALPNPFIKNKGLETEQQAGSICSRIIPAASPFFVPVHEILFSPFFSAVSHFSAGMIRQKENFSGGGKKKSLQRSRHEFSSGPEGSCFRNWRSRCPVKYARFSFFYSSYKLERIRGEIN